MTKAANVDVEPVWASLFAKALEGKDVKELLSNVGSGGGAPVAGGAAAGAAAGGAAEEAKEEEKKEEEKEESDDDMVRTAVPSTIFADFSGLRSLRLNAYRCIKSVSVIASMLNIHSHHPNWKEVMHSVLATLLDAEYLILAPLSECCSES